MDQDIKNILAQCSISTRMTALTFFPERFYMPFAEDVHGEIFAGFIPEKYGLKITVPEVTTLLGG